MGNTRLILKELLKYHVGIQAETRYRNALFYPDGEAFSCEDSSLTFSKFNFPVNRLTRAPFVLRLCKADVIGILSSDCLEYREIFGTTMKGGFVIASLNARLQREEACSLIPYPEAKAVLVGPEFTKIAEMVLNIFLGNLRRISLNRDEDDIKRASGAAQIEPVSSAKGRGESESPSAWMAG